MANKRGRKKKNTREVKQQVELPGGWGKQVIAILMIAVAFMLVVTWFGQGGNWLNVVDETLHKYIGFGRYFVPVLLVYMAVKMWRSDTSRLPLAMWIAGFIMIVLITGFSGMFSEPATVTGGVIGGGMTQGLATTIGKVGAGILYVVLIFVDGVFMLQVSPKAVLSGAKNMVKIKKKTEAAPVGNVATPSGFKINSGVAVKGEAPKEEKVKVHGLLHKAEPSSPVQKAPVPNDKALVSAVDPNWKNPSLNLLEKKQSPADPGNIQQNAMIIKQTLGEFDLDVEMEGANIGPRVTQYTMRPPAGVALSKITGMDKNLALNLAVDKIRIEAPIPGTRSVGVEIPNLRPADVRLRGILESDEWKNSTDALTFAVGKDISGKSVVANLAKMPHLLIAGTTGSGKSVMMNSLIMSLIMRNSPSEMKMIVIDPKQVEMAQYQDIPHLLTPIITATDKALSAMKWAVDEMEKRYTTMAEERVKSIVDYNNKMAGRTVVAEDKDGNEQKYNGGKMPYIVILVDEMADLMMMAGKDLETLIVRIAQKGRAAGVHLVLATQRPEVKVITGLIKSNVPGRIAFAVNNNMDSRIMLDMSGAEKLLGKGDMLMLTTEMMGKPRRIQGVWTSDLDIEKVTNFLREQRAPEYNDEVVAQSVQIKGMTPMGEEGMSGMGRKYDPNDPMVRQAVQICIEAGKFSTSLLQARMQKAHGWVAGLAYWLGDLGIIGPENGHKPRTINIKSMEEFDQIAGL